MKDLFSINDIAKRFGVSRTRPYAWVKGARLPARQVADVFVVERKDLVEFAEARMVEALEEYNRWTKIVVGLYDESTD